MKDNTTKSVNEAKFGRGDQVRIKDRPKYVLDKQLWGKSGYIKNTMGKDIMVTFSNGRTIMVDPRDLEMNPNESVVSEGKKRFYQQDGIGKAKYTISYHDGKEKNKDGSDFYGIKTFRNKQDLEKFRAELLKKGYREDSGYKKESVNEGKFKVDDLVYNKRTKTVGIVRMGDDKYGEVKTDADGNVSVDELEKYNPIKFKHQSNAKVAPSTEREVSKRGLFNPFRLESVVTEEIKKGSVIIPYAMDKYGEFIVDKVFKNKKGETSYTGKFKKSGEKREFILHSKDRVVKESVNEDVWTPEQKRQVEKLDDEFRNLLAKKGIEPYSNTASKMWKSAGFQKNFQQIFQKDETVNEAGLPGEAVGYIQKPNGNKKLVKVFNTYRGGLMWQKRTGMKLLNQSGIERVGVMNKKEWDKNHARFAENLKKADMKVVSKKEWDKTHKDFKGMVDGKPYMMWLDKKTQSTVYGPVTIKEDVVSEVTPLQLSTGQMKQLHNAYGKLSYDQMKKMMMRVVSRDKFIDLIKRFDNSSLQKLVNMEPNTPFSKTVQAFIDGKLN